MGKWEEMTVFVSESRGDEKVVELGGLLAVCELLCPPLPLQGQRPGLWQPEEAVKVSHFTVGNQIQGSHGGHPVQLA